MKKLIFMVFFLPMFVSAQQVGKTTSCNEQPKGCVYQQQQDVAADTATRITQQLIKKLNGKTFRVVLNEFPYNGRRNTLLVYKNDSDIYSKVVIMEAFNIAPNPKNFHLVTSTDGKKLVVKYQYNGEVKIIEFN